jgi:hypothetical protein
MPAWLLDFGDAMEWITPIALLLWIAQYSVLAPWWSQFTGTWQVILALVIVAIYIPSLMAVADPAGYAHFAQAQWYQWLALCIVTASAVAAVGLIAKWESVRRLRKRTGRALLPAEMAARIRELDAEVASLRERLGEVNELNETEPCGG